MDLHVEVKSCGLFGASRRVGETSHRGEETSCSGEVVWPVRLHIEVKCSDLVEQVIFRGEDVELA